LPYFGFPGLNWKRSLTQCRGYQKLLDLIERLETIAAVKVGLDEMKTGKGQPPIRFG
jgi:hypothetical protein